MPQEKCDPVAIVVCAVCLLFLVGLFLLGIQAYRSAEDSYRKPLPSTSLPTRRI